MAVRSADWLDLMKREYLRKFVPGGGSSIKFVIGGDVELAEIRRELAALAGERKLYSIAVDAATTKIHMIQDVFVAVSRSIDWETLAQTWLEDAFRRHQYMWPRPGTSVPLLEIAAANDVNEQLLRREVHQWITREILRRNELAQDFRSAMGHLCLRRMEPDDERATAPVVEWLRGELRTIGSVREVPINAKITRHNGRSMLRSLCHWVRLCGVPGIVATMTLTQLARVGAAAGEGIRYSTPAVLVPAFGAG